MFILASVIRWRVCEFELPRMQMSVLDDIPTQRRVSTSQDAIMDFTQTNPTQEDFTRFHSVKEQTLTSTSMVLANTPFFPWQGVSRATQDSPIPDDT
ncbi:hypothetical protein COOONC_26698, partial [Cooperia oncophora]